MEDAARAAALEVIMPQAQMMAVQEVLSFLLADYSRRTNTPLSALHNRSQDAASSSAKAYRQQMQSAGGDSQQIELLDLTDQAVASALDALYALATAQLQPSPRPSPG